MKLHQTHPNPRGTSNLPVPGPGRPKGSLNTLAGVKAMLERESFDVMHEAVKRFRDPTTPHASKDHCLSIVADRVLPRLRAVEVTGAGGNELRNILISIVAGGQSQAVVSAPVAPIIDSAIGQAVLECAVEDDENDNPLITLDSP